MRHSAFRDGDKRRAPPPRHHPAVVSTCLRQQQEWSVPAVRRVSACHGRGQCRRPLPFRTFPAGKPATPLTSSLGTACPQEKGDAQKTREVARKILLANTQ